MPGTFPVLNLKPNGDVEQINVKQIGTSPTLKDIQLYLKKKCTPTLITSYLYGTQRISMFGYTKGKEEELSQHQLAPPCEVSELYGSIILIAHSSKVAWDSSRHTIEIFTPAHYETFYERACSGELEEADEEDEQNNEECDSNNIIEEEEEDDIEGNEEHILEDEVGETDGLDIVEEEVVPRMRISRKVIKIDPQQIQFQFKSELSYETEANLTVVENNVYRNITYGVYLKQLSLVCSPVDVLELEMGVYNATLDEAKRRLIPLTWKHETFCWIYKMISKRTISNFNPNSYIGNKTLIRRWKEGEISLSVIGSWTSYELNPSQWKDLKEQQMRREQRILEGNLSMATDRFRCSGCQKKMCSYYELQTRSADEPMTIFIKCLSCGKQWKQ
jgi:hypothetical protein